MDSAPHAHKVSLITHRLHCLSCAIKRGFQGQPQKTPADTATTDYRGEALTATRSELKANRLRGVHYCMLVRDGWPAADSVRVQEVLGTDSGALKQRC